MSNQINVSSLSQLYDALASATGGEVILLEGGEYGDMCLGKKSGFNVTFPSNVTIASADPGNPAIFSGLDVRDAANLTFDGITFDYEFQAGDPIYLRPFSVSDSSNVTIRNSTFDGDVAQGVSEVSDGYGYGIGLSFRGSTGVTVESNEFFDFHRGMTISESGDVTVRSNDVRTIRMDGMNFSEITGALIEDNHIHDFRGALNSGDHSDMIQFWTNGTDAPSTDITIRNNHLDIGEGTFTQSIFMRNDMVDRGLAGAEMFYRDVVIENNVIVNAHSHGITVGETDGLTIRSNSVLHADGLNADGVDALIEIPRINVAETSTNVAIIQNATADITGHTGQSDWTVFSNAFVQDRDPGAPGYYGDVFLSTSLVAVDGVHDFRALPGGMLDNLTAGATSTIGAIKAPGITTQFHVTNAEDSAAIRHFDASFSSDGQADLPEGTEYHWDFGDGTTATGIQATHAFATGGVYDVSLVVELPNGQSQTRSLPVEISGPNVLSYTAQAGLTAFEDGSTAFVDIEGSVTSDGIHLGGTGSAAHIDRTYVDDILGQDEFSLSMTLASASPESAGEVMRLHSSFIVSVTSKGELYLEAFDEGGERIRLTTEGAKLSDMAAHDIDITFGDGVLGISVDGNALASTQMTAPLADVGSHDLTFGNPWNAANFDGLLSALEITVNEGDYSEVLPAPDDAVIIPEEVIMPEDMAPDETTDAAAPDMPYPEPNVLSYTAESGLTAFEDGSMAFVDIEGSVSSDGIHLGGTGSAAHIDRAYVDGILGQDEFSLSMTLASASPESAGEVMRLHSSFIVSVTSGGELHLEAFDEGGERIRLTTEGAKLSDMAAHDIDITFGDGVLAINVDGDTLASTQMTTPLADVGRHDLTFGNPWNNRANFDGLLSSLEITVNEGDFSGVLPAPDNPVIVFDEGISDTLPDAPDTVAQVRAQEAFAWHALQDAWAPYLEAMPWNQAIRSEDLPMTMYDGYFA